MYINKLTKDDIKNYIIKNNYDVKDNEIDIIYFYIKNYHEEFFNDPNLILNKIKNDLSASTYQEIIKLYNQYKNSIN